MERPSGPLSEAGRSFLWSEIERGFLHQGWGRSGMALLRSDGSVLPRAAWMKNFLSSAREDHWSPSDRTRRKAHRRYTLLSHTLEITDGDLILITNMTETSRDGLLLARALK